MGSRGKKAGPGDLCVYFAEIQEQDGETSVLPQVSQLIQKCIEDKIFSENVDHVAVCRSDLSDEIEFEPATWDGLRSSLKLLNETKVSEGGIKNPINSLQDICNALNRQSKKDSYEDKKILFFSNLSSYILEEEDINKLAEKLLASDIFISIVLPNKCDMTDIQLQNSKLLKSVFNAEKFDGISVVTNLMKATRQILNTQSKKATRPSPWNIPLEISPEITISVSGYVCTRKNKIGEMTRGLMKQVGSEIRAIETENTLNQQQNQLALDNDRQENGEDKTVVVEEAKKVVEKEITWTENDGTVVSEDDMGKAFFFGDKLVPFNDLEKGDTYESGEKCLKLLAFCPVKNVSPAYQIGDGITLFYPRKGDVNSEVKFKALMQAMVNTNRLAVVRKVYLKNKKVTLASLVPDEERQCLIFSELCFADDVSVPHLPLLVKPEDLKNDADPILNEKEELIDKLISARTINNFSVSQGPSDPAVAVLRRSITQKVIKQSSRTNQGIANIDKADNIEIYFKTLITNATDIEDVVPAICESFPLENNTKEGERFAGKNVFRKRPAEEELQEEDSDKKPKVEVESIDEAREEPEENEGGIDDLLDEL